MDFRDRRIWYTVAAVIIMVIIVYAAGWFSTHPAPAPPSNLPPHHRVLSGGQASSHPPSLAQPRAEIVSISDRVAVSVNRSIRRTPRVPARPQEHSY
jgi:hypothetical protein